MMQTFPFGKNLKNHTFGIHDTYKIGHSWYMGSSASTSINLFPSNLQPCNNKPSTLRVDDPDNSEGFHEEKSERFSKQ